MTLLPIWLVVLMCSSGPATWLAARYLPRLWRRMFPRVTVLEWHPGGKSVIRERWGKSPFVREGEEIPGTRFVYVPPTNCGGKQESAS